jgi:hypothetical protein
MDMIGDRPAKVGGRDGEVGGCAKETDDGRIAVVECGHGVEEMGDEASAAHDG